jgi:hypothetical protein
LTFKHKTRSRSIDLLLVLALFLILSNNFVDQQAGEQSELLTATFDGFACKMRTAVRKGYLPDLLASRVNAGSRWFKSNKGSQKIPYTRVCGIFTYYLFTLHFSLNWRVRNFK